MKSRDSKGKEDLLFEIGTEELPASFATSALEQIEGLARELLLQSRLPYETLRTLGTPRRLTVMVHGLSAKQEESVREIKGPAKAQAYDASGNATRALQGFMKSQRVSDGDITIKEIDGKPYCYAMKRERGEAALAVLPSILSTLLTRLSFPKSTRWGEGGLRFGRPIRWLLALYGSEPLPVRVEAENGSQGEGNALAAQSFTYGHRFLSAGKIPLSHPSEYEETLSKNFVVCDQEKRRSMIEKQVLGLASKVHAVPFEVEALLPEVNFLVEYPTAFLGKFEPRFLSLPREVLVSVMRDQQRYFPLSDQGGNLLPSFVGVRNGGEEHLDLVREGNEKVLAARFKDAEFFFQEDLKVPLHERVPALSSQIFHKKLGSMAAKSDRIYSLSRDIYELLEKEEKGKGAKRFTQEISEKVSRTAELCKADLTTHMVFEFPHLQGAMGKEYARLTGEDPEVAQGILDHYLPRGQGDLLPETLNGTIVGIADRLDTLVGFFSINLIPSGSTDPFALRRTANGLIQILLERDLHLHLEKLSELSFLTYQARGYEGKSPLPSLKEFFLQRIEGIFGALGLQYDIVRCLLPVSLEDLPMTVKKGRALEELRSREEFAPLLVAASRVLNILRGVEVMGEGLDPSLFLEPQESALYEEYTRVHPAFLSARTEERFLDSLLLLCGLVVPINSFFDKVLVMTQDEKIRNNRLLLLRKIALLFQEFGDPGQIVLEGQLAAKPA